LIGFIKFAIDIYIAAAALTSFPYCNPFAVAARNKQREQEAKTTQVGCSSD